MTLTRRYFLSVLMVLFCLPLVSQERGEIEQRYEAIIERPMGVAPAISDSAWGQLVQKALDAPDSTVSLQTKSTASLQMRLDRERVFCVVSVSGLVTYELLLAPWRIQGEQPLLQITTLERPYRVSQLTAYLPKLDKPWELAPSISGTEWLLPKSERKLSAETSAALQSQIARMPLVLTFATEQGRREVRLSVTPSLEGWTTREECERIEQIISTSPLDYQLTRRGVLKRVK